VGVPTTNLALALPQLLGGKGGFWRTQAEALGFSVAAYVAMYLLASLPPPWAEAISLASLGVYVWAGWRLAAGSGSQPRRAARLLTWALLAALLGGVAGWLLAWFLPPPRPLWGVDASPSTPTLGAVLLGSVLVVVPLVAAGRGAARLRRAARHRLRWQLTLSYLLVSSLVTLLVYLVLGLYIGISSLSLESPLTEPTLAAQRATLVLEPLLRAGADASELEATLGSLLDGTARAPITAGGAVADSASQPALSGVRRLALVRPTGTTYSVVAAAPDAPRAELLASLAAVFVQARAGSCVSGRPVGGTLADTAVCPLRDARGELDAFVLVETDYAQAGAQASAALGRIISVTTTLLVAALTSLLLTSVVILLATGAVGYLLAQRLTRRLEQLANATSALAAGTHQPSIVVEADDELGRLSGDFNRMALRLAEREQALLVSKERAEQLLAGNRRLVANVSHELRTPLATLRGYLEALEQTHGNQLPNQDLQIIQGEVQRLTRLIDDLFTLAQAEEQRLPLVITAVDVVALIHDLAARLAPLARREREVELVVALPVALPPIAADRARLEQVLLNLVQNALRHTPPGGLVAFEGQAAHDTVTLAVADTGIGIAPEEQQLIFERFYRGDTSRARETGGAGLGLALVKELVTAMQGTVTVESVAGHGSRFSLTFKIAVGEATQHHP
jgi:signal transduction histidine kinase